MKNNQVEATPDLCVFIGRFQPLHAGHIRVIREGLHRASYMVVLVGSANEPRSVRNPFHANERADMIRAAFDNNPRLIVLPLEDSDYNLSDWLDRAHGTVGQAWDQIKAIHPNAPQAPVVALIGHAKDATSFYLNLFPYWGSIDVPQAHPLCATTVRRELFGDYEMILPDLLEHENDPKPWSLSVYLDTYIAKAHARARAFLVSQEKKIETANPQYPADLTLPVIKLLEAFLDQPGYDTVGAEYAVVWRGKFLWRQAPYAPIFQTADAIVVQSGHVLMIKRNSYPGKGLWALPGGYVEENEPVMDGCFRELREETGLKVPEAVLRGHMVAQKRFDAPFRSARGRVITEAVLIHLAPGPLAKIKWGGQPGDEETQEIAWILKSKLRRDQCFEDHYSIIKNMTGGI